MAKILKPIIITISGIILFVFLALLIAPVLFKNQLMNLAKTELNKMLLAKVDFKDLKLSFIRNFPNAYIALDGLEVVGVGDFEDELLVAFDSFNVTVDIMSVIKMENIEVKSIMLDRARVNGHILEDGQANWNVMRPSEKAAADEDAPEEEIEEIIEEKKEVAEADKDDTGPFKFKVGLNKFEIRDMQVAFHDDSRKMHAGIETFNFTLRGDMKRENVDLKILLAIDGIDFWMNGVHMANKANVGFISEIAADLKNMRFVIKDNRFNLNDIVLKFDGSVAMQEGDIIADVTFGTERTDFKSLLSLVPAVYMTDFKDLKTTGSLELSGDVKGTYSKNMMPTANVKLNVNNATFSYPNLPKSVEKINIAVRAHYDGEVFDRTTADVDRFSFEIAENPFNIEVHVKTPESDLQVGAKFAGKIDFDSIIDIVPIKDTTLNGLLECDISLDGKLSTLQNERYEDFKAAGSLKLSRFNFKNPSFQQGAQISSMLLNFTPRYVELANLDAKTGNTDVSLNGSLENFIPFVLRGDTVKGALTLRSNNIDLNEFMGGDKEKTEKKDEPEKEKSKMSVIEVPKNIDFALNVNLGRVLFDQLPITNIVGAITVRDGKLDMRNLGMNLLEGNMNLNGVYNTQDMTLPFIDFGLNINQFEISSALTSFSFLENILPEPQNYVGKVSAILTLYSILGEHMSPELNTIASKGNLRTHNLQIRNSEIFGTLSDILRNENWRNPTLGNVNVGFEIKNGRLYIEDPIVMNMPPSKIEIKGDQGLDMTLNYRIDATMPVSAIGSGATNILGSIPGGANIREVKLTGNIKGTVKKPEISLSVADMATAVRDQVVGAVRTQVNEGINRQIDQIMAEANRQAANFRSSSKQAADRVRREANASADKVIADAAKVSNPIARAAAQTAASETAKKLRSEGEANAKKLEQEGENQAKTVLAAAQKKADELRR